MRGIVLAALAALTLAACDRPQPEPGKVSDIKIGGPFQLVDTQSRPVTQQTLRGKPTAIFFGFTYCPEVCPTTLTEMTAALEELGPAADKLNVVFVSVDPERDTPEQMRTYLTNFDPRISGFTGTPAQVETVTKAYRIYHKKIPVEGGSYTVDHSSAVYLFDKDGGFVRPLSYGMPHELFVSGLRQLISGR